MQETVDSLIRGIEGVNKKKAIKFWDDLQKFIPQAAGSTKSHHAWEGGYADHIQEVMNIAQLLYVQLSSSRTLPFTLSSAYLVLFLHDCEKPFRHATDQQLSNFSWIVKRPTKSDKDFQNLLIAQYGFDISQEEGNALRYVEGEPDAEYIEGNRLQGPLAAFCHVCDTISARIWYDYPQR